MTRTPANAVQLDTLPDVLMPIEVVKVLRLDEEMRKDGTIRQRTTADALRSLQHLARKRVLMPLVGAGKASRYAKATVKRYLDGTTETMSIGLADRE